MARTVHVDLEADVAGFLGPVLESARATEKLDDKVDELDRSLNKIPADALKAGAAMKLLSGDVKDVGTNFAAVGDKSTAMTVLDSRIRSTRAEVKKLTDEFVKTGDVGIFHKLGQSSGDLDALQRIRKDLVNAVGNAGDEGGKGFIRRFVDSLGSGSNSMLQGLSNIPFAGAIFKPIASAIESMPPEVQAAVGAAIVSAIVLSASAIGAALNGALLAGIGLGGIGLGIIGQIRNPAVRAAFSSLGKDLFTELTYASSGFAVPLVNSASILKTALSAALQSFKKDLDGLAPHLEPLARAIAALFTHMGPGLSDAFKAAGPILERLAKELPGLGDSLSRFFALLADGSKGAGDGLSLLFLTIETLIIGIGGLIDGLSHLYNWFLAPGKAIKGWWDDLRGNTQGAAHGLNGLSDSVDNLGNSAAGAQPSLDELNATLNKTTVTTDTLAASMVHKLFAATMGLQQANLSFNESLLNVDDALKQNGRTLDSHTRKGIANQHAILSSVTANMELYQAQIAAGDSATNAAHNYDVNTAALERQLRKAGLTSAQIDGLIGRYRKVPANVNTAMAIQGLTEAINGLADLLRLINHIPSSKTTVITTRYVTTGSRAGNLQTGQSRLGSGFALGGIRHAADGLLIPARDPGSVLVGEPSTRGEALIPLGGISQNRAMGLAQTVGNNYGFNVSPWGSGPKGISLTIEFAGDTDSAFSSAFMGLVRTGKVQINAR